MNQEYVVVVDVHPCKTTQITHKKPRIRTG